MLFSYFLVGDPFAFEAFKLGIAFGVAAGSGVNGFYQIVMQAMIVTGLFFAKRINFLGFVIFSNISALDAVCFFSITGSTASGRNSGSLS